MTRRLITAEELRARFTYDPETGVFCCGQKIVGGFDKNGYRQISIDRRLYRAGRLAWLYVYGKWPDGVAEHKNGIPDDDRIDNLRDVSQAINVQNYRKPMRNNKSGYLGVSAARNKFVAQITVGGKYTFLGYFKTAEGAYAAYVSAKRKLHVGCTI